MLGGHAPSEAEFSAYISSFPSQFQELLDSNLTVALLMLCHEESDLEDYLTLIPGSETDVEGLQQQFCNISLEDLEVEFEEEFGLLDFDGLVRMYWTVRVPMFCTFCQMFVLTSPLLDLA